VDRCRVLEVVAGLAAVTFVALLVWEDFIRPTQAPRSHGLRLGYYSTSFLVLACVILLGVWDC